MNPFLIPGAADSHQAPLRPLDHPEHIGLYVDVDGFEAGYATFKEAFDTPASLLEAGGFVLVNGTGTCGKTSLINRCAHWLHEELTAAGLQPRIFDPSGRVAPNIAVERRMRLVYELLVRHQNESFDQAEFAGLEQGKDDLVSGYARVSDALPKKVVLLVLLPFAELPDEVLAYAQLVQPRIVFFAENSTPDLAVLSNSLGVPPGTRTARLVLGALREGDGRRFSRERTGEDGADAQPPLNIEAAEEMLRRRRDAGTSLTIGQLQRYFYGYYKEINEMRVPPSGPVDYYEIIGHIFKQVPLP